MDDPVLIHMVRCWSWYICRVPEIRSIFFQLLSHMYFSLAERVFQWSKRRRLIRDHGASTAAAELLM